MPKKAPARVMAEEKAAIDRDWLKLFDAPAQFDRVTRAQIQAVAREILDKRRRTVGVLVPDDVSDEVPDDVAADVAEEEGE